MQVKVYSTLKPGQIRTVFRRINSFLAKVECYFEIDSQEGLWRTYPEENKKSQPQQHSLRSLVALPAVGNKLWGT